MAEQLAFDFDALTRDPYTGRAPLGFTIAPLTIEEIDEAGDEYVRQFGNFGMHVGHPHIWHRGYNSTDATEGHPFVMVSADLGCTFGEHPQDGPCCCVGGVIHRGVCGCGWVSSINPDEDPAVAEWHDHAWNGWRTLPVVPSSVPKDAAKKVREWMDESYPMGWVRPGVPVITIRSAGGTRSVAGRAPMGGFDLSSTLLEVAA